MSDQNFCPVCGQYSEFKSAGRVSRRRAKCRICGSKERHRLLWAFLQRRSELFEFGEGALKVLHVAPEKALGPHVARRLGSGYVSFDLQMAGVRVHGDLSRMPFRSQVFDAVLCSHVLEHVDDDRAAIAELKRVLKPDAKAIIMVPISAPETFEDPSVTDPRRRLELFGREDHVRRYGPDFENRLKDAGFNYRVERPSDFLAQDEISSMAVKRREKIFWCHNHVC